jgi:ribonuclease BN (tRNA processing enzyme)
MRLVIIGCSGSFAGPKSAASCYIVQGRDASRRIWTTVFDMGSGAFGPLQGFVAPEAIDFIGLSHLHPDHCADMTGLHVYAKYRPGTALDSLPVYGPKGTNEHLATIQYSSDPAHPQGKLNVLHWQAGETVTVGPLQITPYPVLHPVEAWGFRIVGPSALDGRPKVLGFSGDTDLCEGLDELAHEADLLLIEAAFEQGRDSARGVHLTGVRAGQAATRANAKRVVVTHIAPWTDPGVTMAEVRQQYVGPARVARPGAHYIL